MTDYYRTGRRRVLFVCRYTTAMIDNNLNYSVNRKVSGILGLFENLGYSTWVLKTSDYGFFRKQRSIVSRETYFGMINSNFYVVWFPRILNYSIAIIKNAFILRRINYKFDFVIFWDFLPDTFLPVYLSNVSKAKVIVDIEELISFDPEASFFFKKFEKLFIERYKGIRYFVSNESLSFSADRAFVINGFFAESLEEELYCVQLLKSFKESKKLRVFYSSRFDNNRGIKIIIDLIKLDIADQKFNFVICGFGSKFYFDQLVELTELHKGLEVFYQVERWVFLEKLVNSDISINLLMSGSFGSNSFPSKLVEYKCLGGTILSNIDYVEIRDCSILIDYCAESIYSKISELFSEGSFVRSMNNNFEEILKVGIQNKSLELKMFLHDS